MKKTEIIVGDRVFISRRQAEVLRIDGKHAVVRTLEDGVARPCYLDELVVDEAWAATHSEAQEQPTFRVTLGMAQLARWSHG